MGVHDNMPSVICYAYAPVDRMAFSADSLPQRKGTYATIGILLAPPWYTI